MPAWEIAAATALMVLLAAGIWLTIYALTKPIPAPTRTKDDHGTDR